MEQQEENWQIDHIARCRDDLHTALAEMEALAELEAKEAPATTGSGDE